MLPNFILNRKFWYFRPHICAKRVFVVQNRNSERHHLTQHIRISLGFEFHCKQTILSFWAKFTQKGYFQSKIEKINITIEFSLLKLLQVLNCVLNTQFWYFHWYFGTNLPKKGISSPKQEKWTSPLNSASKKGGDLKIFP